MVSNSLALLSFFLTLAIMHCSFASQQANAFRHQVILSMPRNQNELDDRQIKVVMADAKEKAVRSRKKQLPQGYSFSNFRTIKVLLEIIIVSLVLYFETTIVVTRHKGICKICARFVQCVPTYTYSTVHTLHWSAAECKQ